MLLLLLCTLLRFTAAEKVDWSTATEFQLYGKMQVSAFSKLTNNEIAGMKFKTLNLNKGKYFLSNSKVLNEMILWKGGGYFALIKFKDGSSRKLLLNKFGGTFRDGTGMENYKIDEKLRDEWHEFISSE